MARIAGIDLPNSKKLYIALRYIYGIGPFVSNEIINELNLNATKKVKDLTEEEVNKISSLISKNLKVEGDLRREIQSNIKRLIEIGSYRGIRHRRNLPVRGQRTKTNGRTRRGKRKTVGSGKSSFLKNKK
ncbi:MAG: 30S ribosomal protein S13 [Endomicrobium sp.]|jgi:small subunit ribosomal protein S13|nr:30S ribosomal protein S13 [Endomicrobium sp.]